MEIRTQDLNHEYRDNNLPKFRGLKFFRGFFKIVKSFKNY